MQTISNAPSGQTYDNWSDVFKESRQMTFRAFNTGSIYSSLKPYTQQESIPSDFDSSQILDYPVMVFYFNHPTKGDILIDSGFDKSFHDNPPFGNLSSFVIDFLNSNKASYTQKKNEDLLFHLKKYNIQPLYTFLTHMHPDHTAGIPALPSHCKICYGKGENSSHYKLMTGDHLNGKKDIYLIDVNSGNAIPPFNKALDIFSDGTFWALSTPGHTKDHLAYLINAAPTPMRIVGDAELKKWGMEKGVFMNTDYGEKGKQAVQSSARMIREFHSMYPEVQIWFSHDKESITL